PRPTRLIRALVAEPTTALVRGTTHENRPNLAPTFFDAILGTYEGTRLGQQEIHGEILDISPGAWFATFDAANHVSESAEYDPRFAVHLGIDAGVSRHTAAVWFQCRQVDAYRWRITVFGDYYAEGKSTEQNARAIKLRSDELPSRGRLDAVR